MAAYKLNCTKIIPLRDDVIVYNMEFSERVRKGIILLNDDGKTRGIRPRWGQVYAIGPDQSTVKVGQWLLIAHGRWTRGFELFDENLNNDIVIRRIDHANILLVSDDQPNDETLGMYE